MRLDAGEVLALGFGDAQLLEGIFDRSGHIIPRPLFCRCRAHEIVELLEVEGAQIDAPGGHGHIEEGIQCFQPEVEHPLRLVLECRDLTYDILADPAP